MIPQRLELNKLNANQNATGKKKSTEDDPEDISFNEYLKGCKNKQKPNNKKMKSLGLVNVLKKQRNIAKKSIHLTVHIIFHIILNVVSRV